MIYYKTYRIIDGKPRWVIVDETGKIINKNPSNDELKCTDKEPRKPYDTRKKKYTDKELLNFLRLFKKKEGKIPKTGDFKNNSDYTGSDIYRKRFGSWNKALEKAFDIKRKKGASEKYTDEELLVYLRIYFEEKGRNPTEIDFSNSNPEYPNFGTYQNRFGNWSNALKLAGLDIDLMGKQGDKYRGRQAEIMVINHFKQHPIDLAGENQNSPCDGICPNGKTYDVKSSKLHDDTYWLFETNNKYKEEIEIYYFLAFNEDYTELMYVWRVPGEIAEKDNFYVGLNPSYDFDVEDMEKYNIIDKFKDIKIKE